MEQTELLSMTGFGEAVRDLSQGRLRVEIRTVNHRHLNLQCRTLPGMERLQPSLERCLRQFFNRGHVTLNVELDREAAAESEPVPVDLDRAREIRDAFRYLQKELRLGGTVDVGLLAGFREIFRSGNREEEEPGVEPQELLEAVEEAAAEVLTMRRTEGARLAEDLAGRLRVMEEALGQVEAMAPERLLRERDRLREAVKKLLNGEVEVDEERIAREIAHLAERWDIHEEIVRFRSHLAMFRTTLEGKVSGGAGKRLSFIAQELLREANTIGSKANDAGITAQVVTLKEEIDRLREQVENVE